MNTNVTTHIRPHRIGRFELQRMLQERRDVETWAGHQRFPGGVRRPCLVHKWSGGGGKSRAQFMLEAHLARWCDHPNVLRTLGFEATDERLYYAVEQPKSASVADLLARHGPTLEPEVAICVVRSVARAMVFFHELETPRGRRVGVCCHSLSADDVLISAEGDVKVHPIRIRSSAVLNSEKFGGQVGARRVQNAARYDVFLLGQMMMRLLLGSNAEISVNMAATDSTDLAKVAVTRVPQRYRAEVYRSLVWSLGALEDQASSYAVGVLLERLEQLPGGRSVLSRAVERWMPVRVEPAPSAEDRTRLASGCRRTANA